MKQFFGKHLLLVLLSAALLMTLTIAFVPAVNGPVTDYIGEKFGPKADEMGIIPFSFIYTPDRKLANGDLVEYKVNLTNPFPDKCNVTSLYIETKGLENFEISPKDQNNISILTDDNKDWISPYSLWHVGGNREVTLADGVYSIKGTANIKENKYQHIGEKGNPFFIQLELRVKDDLQYGDYQKYYEAKQVCDNYNYSNYDINERDIHSRYIPTTNMGNGKIKYKVYIPYSKSDVVMVEENKNIPKADNKDLATVSFQLKDDLGNYVTTNNLIFCTWAEASIDKINFAKYPCDTGPTLTINSTDKVYLRSNELYVGIKAETFISGEKVAYFENIWFDKNYQSNNDTPLSNNNTSNNSTASNQTTQSPEQSASNNTQTPSPNQQTAAPTSSSQQSSLAVTQTSPTSQTSTNQTAQTSTTSTIPPSQPEVVAPKKEVVIDSSNLNLSDPSKAKVMVGGKEIKDFKITEDGKVSVTLPDNITGAVDITVQDEQGNTATKEVKVEKQTFWQKVSSGFSKVIRSIKNFFLRLF